MFKAVHRQKGQSWQILHETSRSPVLQLNHSLDDGILFNHFDLLSDRLLQNQLRVPRRDCLNLSLHLLLRYRAGIIPCDANLQIS